jgi:hypothetical protein
MRFLGIVWAVLVSGLAGCAPQADVATGVHGQYAEASRLLILAAAKGPVPLSVDRVPTTTEGSVDETSLLAAANDAVDWTGARFALVPAKPDDYHVLLRFERVPSDPDTACKAVDSPQRAAPSPLPEPGLRLHAIACNGPQPVADVIARNERATASAATDLTRASLRRLFPGGSGGWGFPGVSLGVGIGSNGSGAGVGLHF